MKKIKLEPVKTLTGSPFAFPQFDEEEKPKVKQNDKGVDELDLMHTTGLLDILEYFILRGIPNDKYTKKDAIHVGNVYRFIQIARKDKTSILEIGEDDHDWLKAKLNDEAIGIRMFTKNSAIITDAVENIEKPHQPKEKEKGEE